MHEERKTNSAIGHIDHDEEEAEPGKADSEVAPIPGAPVEAAVQTTTGACGLRRVPKGTKSRTDRPLVAVINGVKWASTFTVAPAATSSFPKRHGLSNLQHGPGLVQ